MPNVIIKGVGSCIPDRVVPNSEFLNHVFYQPDGTPYPDENDVIIRKFEKITGRVHTLRERADINLVNQTLITHNACCNERSTK